MASYFQTLELICAKFPFYKRMHALMGSSPTVNKLAVVHSGTPLNLGILDRDGSSKVSLTCLP